MDRSCCVCVSPTARLQSSFWPHPTPVLVWEAWGGQQLTTLNSCVTCVRAAASPRKRLTFSGVNGRLPPRLLKLAASCSEVLVLLLDPGYLRLQLVDHSFEKFRGLCDSTLEHALHDRGVLRLEVVRWHVGVACRSSEIRYGATFDSSFTVGLFKNMVLGAGSTWLLPLYRPQARRGPCALCDARTASSSLCL